MFRILFVEDDAQVAEFCAKRLRDRGFEVLRADRMDFALELFHRQSFDLVITDFHLQQGSGRRLLNALRKESADLPVFLITGTPFVSEQALSTFRFDVVFLKPFSFRALLEEIEKALGSILPSHS